MSSPLYRTQRWLRMRAHQLAIEPLCRMCKALGRITPATIADHVEPHRGNAEAFWSNPLQSLCATCHSAAKQAQERTGRLRGCTAEGLPLDPAHAWNAGGGQKFGQQRS